MLARTLGCCVFSCAVTQGQDRPRKETYGTAAKAAAPMRGDDNAHGAGQRFSDRVEKVLGAEQPAKGEWGILIADAKSGEVLFAQNADRYFVPASNMKLFTTALALATLGADYRFRTTLEAQNSIGTDGRLEGSLYLVGRGDPNLSNRKFPLNGKEEFDGPPEKAIAELASQIVAGGRERHWRRHCRGRFVFPARALSKRLGN